MFFALTATASMGQTLETTTEQFTGYVKMDRASGQVLRVLNGAVYTGNWLIKVESTDEPQTFDIPSWVTRICPGAFSGANISTLRFPSSWTEAVLRQPSIFISPHAFDNSGIQNFETYNDGGTTSMSSVLNANNDNVIAHYNVAGIRNDRSAEGIDIVRFSDGNIKKFIKK